MIAVGPPFSGFVEFAHYASGETAMRIWPTPLFEGAPLCTATVALVHHGAEAPGDCAVWLKAWAECEGLPQCLEASGIVLLGEQRHACGFSEAIMAALTPVAIAEMRRQEYGAC